MSIDAIWNMQYSKGMDIIGYSLETAAEVGRRLSEGQVGIVPCDTIYGLCGRADEERAERMEQVLHALYDWGEHVAQCVENLDAAADEQ